MNQQRLIRFMERLVCSSQRKVILILDNLRVHHGKLVAAWLKRHTEKIEVFFLPPYAAEDISHKIQSFMRKLQQYPSHVSCFFHHPLLSYLFSQK